jgi:hypothetical protein
MQQAASSTLVVSTGDFVGGFDSTIDETITGLPAGMSYKVTGATAANNMVNLSYLLTAASSTPAGTYPVTVVAIGAGITHSALVQVTVTASTATTKH